MKTFALRTLIVATLIALSAGTASAQAGAPTCASMSGPSSGRLSIRAGSRYSQQCSAAVAGYLTELGVHMGLNQHLYDAELVIQINGIEVLARLFTGLVERQSDGVTVFPLKQIPQRLAVGDYVTFSIRPHRDIGLTATQLADPSIPPSALEGYGTVNARFYVRVGSRPDLSAYPPPVTDPVLIRSTMGQGASSWQLGKGSTFTQTFVAKGSGVPKVLGVAISSTGFHFDCNVAISVRGTKVFEKSYAGVSAADDRASRFGPVVVFPLTEMNATVSAGDTVSFSITPVVAVGVIVVPGEEVGISKSAFPRYASTSLEFYLKK